jgi:hypothetical protein
VDFESTPIYVDLDKLTTTRGQRLR